MPTISPVQSADVRASIARAAERTGVDFDYLLAQARLESGLNPDAKARTSSATGLYQFVDSTWLDTLDRHGSKHGMAWAGDTIGAGGRVADAGTRAQLLALRYDADTSSLMAAELARDNATGLRTSLGREPDSTELYLAHFLGLGGAQKFLDINASSPGTVAAGVLPAAARANRTIFYDGGRARSVSEVMGVLRDKVNGALAQGGSAPEGVPAYDSYASRFAGLQSAHYARTTPASSSLSSASANTGGQPAARPSMADTLKATFGDGSGLPQNTRARVGDAYAKLKAFGL